MRRLLRLSIITGLIVWTLQPITRGETRANDPWKPLLRASSLSTRDRAIVGYLRPWLAPTDYLALDTDRRKQLLRYADNRLFSDTPLARCWSPDTPLHVLFAYHAVEEAAHAIKNHRKANQFFARWSRTATNGSGQNVQGRPVTLTWSIVPDGTPIASDPGIGDSDDPSSLRGRLADLYGGNGGAPEDQPWFPLFRDLFEAIGAQTGITYLYEPSDDGQPISILNPGQPGVRGDLRLCGHPIDGDGDTLAYNFFPDHGDTVIDTSDSWFEDLSGNSRRLVNTISHEHGHGIGLEHVCPIDQTKLLEPFINTGFRGMQFDEIYTLQRWYGDPFEQHDNNTGRNNDSIERARSLGVSAGSPFAFQWLSIDDNSDVDYFLIPLPAGARLTAWVIPSDRIYLEGEEQEQGCEAGTTFDSSSVHDLSLTLLDHTGRVLATADDAPAGEPEGFNQLPVPGAGQRFLRIAGDNTNAAQLYRLEVEISAPAVAIAPGEIRITSESHAPANGQIEPGETIELQVKLSNSGSVTAQNVSATLSAPDQPTSFTGFTTTRNYGTLPHQATAGRTFTLALHGNCGDLLDLELTVTADDGFSRSFPIRLGLGEIIRRLDEDFDAAAVAPLPFRWSSTASRAGNGWARSSTRHDSAEFSVSASSPPSRGASTLTSPPVRIGSQGGTLHFRHFVNTEASSFSPTVGFDGGVLEVSRDGGRWEDIEDAGGVFAQGPYNRTLSEAYQNPLPNRRAWSGSLGWITTVVRIPSHLASEALRFRWTLGHDTSDAEEGWYLDNIMVSSTTCADTRPIVRLAVGNDSASEFLPTGIARLTFSTPLPLAGDLTLPLLTRGSATPGVDTRPFDNVVLPGGQRLLELTFRPLRDNEAEGTEILELSLNPDLVFPEGVPSAVITIADTPYGQWAVTHLGPNSANRPNDDFDHDGSVNAEEYAWQSDPASAHSRPVPNYRREGRFLRVDFPHHALPAFTGVHAETSPDLRRWTRQGVETLPNGFRVPLNLPQRYLRLVYREIPPP